MNLNFKTIIFFVLILAISSKSLKKQINDIKPDNNNNSQPAPMDNIQPEPAPMDNFEPEEVQPEPAPMDNFENEDPFQPEPVPLFGDNFEHEDRPIDQDNSHFDVNEAALKHFIFNAKLDFEDFARAASNLAAEAQSRIPAKEELKELFKMMDIDKDGKMNSEDFRSLVEHIKSDIERDSPRHNNFLQKKNKWFWTTKW